MKDFAPGDVIIIMIVIFVVFAIRSCPEGEGPCGWLGDCSNGYVSSHRWRGPKDHRVYSCQCETTDHGD